MATHPNATPRSLPVRDRLIWQWSRLERMVTARVPMGTRNRLARRRVEMRKWTAQWRPLPNALVIGAMRAGTSSVYKYLEMHPDAHASVRKEVEFFSQRYVRGESWYRAHWPIVPLRREGQVHFEASPGYLFHPLAAQRASQLVPEAKVVVLLRNPVDRALSHFRHMQALGYETLSFDRALEAEEERTGEEWTRAVADPEPHLGKQLVLFSYARRGHYARYLSPWIERYGRQGVHVISFERFVDNTADSFARLLDFLNLRDWAPPTFKNDSRSAATRGDAEISAAARQRLEKEFAESNEELYGLIGHRLGW